ncbi:hypothetical protein DVA86_15260 [Streptomyces armeniacus]|uniref:DUF98 domain-containing protein n=1 Tax=Streptomyces armeniacus TaxID=83291 RepID=A0A345XQ97_9ACTN|nr:hypothetical protein [Streptomyces armeniacus]AXK33813.1 hypothetical protein DVA86_15260 [Streptomyces armeniacus]QIQ28604.1 Nbc8 [Streptomyces sp.]
MPQVSVDAGVTRMLLCSDGSTTILLEALLDCPLAVLVASQQDVPVEELPERAVSALGLSPGDPVVERKSTLVAPDGAPASMNLVVFAAPPSGWSGSASDTAPLGKRLHEASTRQHREVLSYGVTEWPGDEAGDEPDDEAGRPCAYKESVIACDDGVRLYVLEKFHPDHVRLPADAGLLTATGRDAV